jgi:2-C-methyl-D-erythritol 4-phosphate cytidylyltransferase/2-C-methyl-D-erythritol 4-phosphate cytidylyltransferase/2-C-methyl-D-erythritol 2,4-cyclodiphosphate synthase
MKSAALITAAGQSSRFNQSISRQKKELAELDGKSVLRFTLEAFLAVEDVELILITYPLHGGESTVSHVEMLINQLKPRIPVQWIPGGTTRQASVHAGLEALCTYDPEMVLIHDGARPWVTPALIRETLRKAVEIGGAAPGLTTRSALKGIDDHGLITTHHRRSHVIEIQTPQIFRFPEILKAHRLAKRIAREYIDDTEVYTDWGGRVSVVPGDPANIKITYFHDLERIQ